MSYWNYRFVHVGDEVLEGFPSEPIIVLTEVYYDDDGKPSAYIEAGCRFSGNSKEDVAVQFALASEALNEPVMEKDEFTGQIRGESGELHDLEDVLEEQRRLEAEVE